MSKLHVFTVKSSTPVRSVENTPIEGGTRLTIRTESVKLDADVPCGDDMTVTVKSHRRTVISVRSHIEIPFAERHPELVRRDFDDTELVENDVDALLEDAYDAMPPRPIRGEKVERNGYGTRPRR